VLLNDSNGRWACRPDGATTVAVVELGHVIAVPQVAPTLTAAIDLASDASNVTTEVRLSPGTYRGTFDAGEKHLRIRGMGTASATVLDAEFAGRVLTADSSEDIELENLTLARGLVQGSGGAVVVSGSLHATNCIFRDNEARNPPFSRSGVGGAVAFTAGVGRFDGCVFENNRSALGGGAVYASEAQVVIDRGVLRRNRTGTAAVADDQIGLLQAVAAHVTITNTAILANQPGNAAAEPAVLCADAPEGGFSYAAGFRVQQCTIAGNDTNGTAQLRISPGSLSMSDSIVMLTGDSLLRRFGTVLVQNCISDSTNSSFTFVATDPMFVDLDGPDNVLGTSDDTLAVHANSPAIDGGRTSRYLGGTRDLAGNPRVAGAAIDLGAVESPVATCPADLDDGSGTGSPDGGVTIDDLLYFLARFEGGC
jgi:predicted outer membrane repeat protein